MKSKLLGITLLLCLASIASLFVGCPRKQNLDGGEGKHGIVILPDGNHQNVEDKWDVPDGISAVLQKASSTRGVERTELFRIREYKGGEQVGEEKGKLDDQLLVVDVERLNTKALENKFDGHAMQIGVGLANDFRVISAESPTPTPSPKPEGSPDSTSGPSMPQPHLRLQIAESEKMVEEVNKVLGTTPSPTPLHKR